MIFYGTNPIAWSNDDDQSLGAEISLEQCLSEAGSIGFEGIEKGHKMPENPESLSNVLSPHGLWFGGSDPEILAKKYMGLVAHLHTKNLRPNIKVQVIREDLSFLEGVRRGAFTVPGDDEGWLVIEAEQDPAIRNPLKYQTLGLKSLKIMAREAGLDKYI